MNSVLLWTQYRNELRVELSVCLKEKNQKLVSEILNSIRRVNGKIINSLLKSPMV